MTGLSLMGLLPPGGRVVGESSIRLGGRELVGLPDRDLREIRGNEIAMVFQDPMTSLDPTKTIGYQVAEPVRLHRGASRGRGPGAGRRGARRWSACRAPRSGSTTTRTSSPAACGSA